MSRLKEIKNKVLDGKLISKGEALEICELPLQKLCAAANEIREFFCGNAFDLCAIINARSGKCSENCKYCAQSSFYQTVAEEYTLLGTDAIVEQAKYNEEHGILRYSMVTFGKRLSDAEVDQMCDSIRAIRKVSNIALCASFGLLDQTQFAKLKAAGVARIHNNLETSRRNFPNVCTTHTYEDKIAAIRAAQQVGLSVCSGGIMGLGETMEDRIDMVLDLREIAVRSIPVNMLNPIPGTPYANNRILAKEEMCRIVAVFRFLIPAASIRLAGGRGLLSDKGRQCFLSGANAAISGDMLTTAGISIEQDMKMLDELGYKVALWNR
jgi:biotin synthase